MILKWFWLVAKPETQCACFSPLCVALFSLGHEGPAQSRADSYCWQSVLQYSLESLQKQVALSGCWHAAHCRQSSCQDASLTRIRKRSAMVSVQPSHTACWGQSPPDGEEGEHDQTHCLVTKSQRYWNSGTHRIEVVHCVFDFHYYISV